MPRCTSTNKFASYDEPEASVESDEVEDSEYTATVRVVRPCAECGEEMSEYNFELSTELECPTCGTECAGHNEDGSIIPLDDEEGNGKEVTFELASTDDPEIDESGGGRYKKNIFTCNVTANILCQCCDTEFQVSCSDSAAASSFDVLTE